jgi:DNA-binding response OmpR family regulator
MDPMSARILVVDDSPTVRKVVATILEARNYLPILAEDGQAALSLLEQEPVDLVLLDFVMPRMNGYQFCRELRAKPELRNLPVVLMSAKGDKIRGQFVQQTGAIDAITKPFDARGLVAVVEGALKKHGEGRAGPVPDAAAMPEDEALLLRPSRTSMIDDPDVRRVQAAEEFATALTRVINGELRKLRNDEALEQVMARAIERAIKPESLESLGTLFRSLSFGDDTREVLAGDISVISIAEVLQLLDLQRQTGALSVFARDSEVTLYVKEGHVDFAASRGLGNEFLLGRYLLENGALTKDELKTVLDNRSGSKRLLGEALVQLGFVSPLDVRKALMRQTSELVYEVVRFRHGRFAFTVGVESAPAAQAALGLEAGGLVMEGFRRVDEWRLIEGSFDFDDVLYTDPAAIERLDNEKEASLTTAERGVLTAIDGEKTIREIVETTPGSSFELCKILYQLLNSRLVRRKSAA